MKVQIVSGFLGAGKTTLVKQLLAKAGPETAVLVNEYGELGIDGALLEGENVDLLELPSGCICCSLKADLVKGINELYQKAKPKLLIIEPSGIATLSGILEALSSPLIVAAVEFDAIITVVEPDVFLENQEYAVFGTFFKDQLGNADIILVNKCDLNSPEKVAQAIAELEKINPQAVVLPAIYCEVDLPELSGTGQIKIKGESVKLDAVTLRRTGKYSKEGLEELLQRLVSGELGIVFRAKGFIKALDGTYLFELVRGRWEIKTWEKPVEENKFVFIGQELTNIIAEVDSLAIN
jgi:G3E family GTPase